MKLQAINLECIRADRLLFSKLDFSISAGEILFIMGPNGSGKSSLLRILAGLLLPTAGDVHWCDQSIRQDKSYYNNLTYLGHKNGIKVGLSVLENLRLNSTNYKKQDNLVELLQQFSLINYQHVLVQKLSAGQRQRIALIRVLNVSAKLWILDEPLTALDDVAIEYFRNCLQAHVTNGGIVVLASHQYLPLKNAQNIQLKG